jgi:hypothetical protein
MPRLLYLCLPALASCGVISTSAHCTFANENRCQERLDTVSAEAFKGACKVAPNAVPADGACPSADRVGGCFLGKQGDGSSVNDWYYPPKTKADAMSECTGGTFIEP